MKQYVWNIKDQAFNLGGQFYFYGDVVPIELLPSSKRQEQLIARGCLVEKKHEEKAKAPEPKPAPEPEPEPPKTRGRPPKKGR